MIIEQLLVQQQHNDDDNDDDNTGNGWRANKLNFPAEESELHGGGGNVCNKCNEPGHFSRECPHEGDGGGEEGSELHSGNLNGGFWEGQFANRGFDNLDDDDGGGDNGQQAAPSSSTSATLRQKMKRASKIERRGQKRSGF
uniref:CCHC-type domain-containing protein n=1 Tax=Globodera rostochiensis TaxID=31243 RepID=A0A914H488_GLORO